jgi:hypothetical protein
MLTASRTSHTTSSPLQVNMANIYDSNRHPREGYLNLTRRMENEEEDQFDVDLTILDFLVYKAIGLIFEWRTSSDPYHSDLPNALVNMTAGMNGHDLLVVALTDEMKTGERFWVTGTMADV